MKSINEYNVYTLPSLAAGNAADELTIGEDRKIAYVVKDGMIAVPRFYGLSHFGRPDVDKSTEGKPIGIDLSGVLLRSHQKKILLDTIASLRANNGAIIVAPTGIGKTVLALYLISVFKVRTLVITTSVALAQQWKKSFREMTTCTDIGVLGGSKKEVDHDIIVAVIQSVSPQTIGSAVDEIGLVVYDEVHHMAADTFFRRLTMTRPRFLLGLTATPIRRDRLEKMFVYSIGPMIKCADDRKFDVHVFVTKLIYKPRPIEIFADFMKALSSNVRRTAFQCNLIAQIVRERPIPGGVLVTTHEVRHSMQVFMLLRELLPEMKIAIVYGKSRKFDGDEDVIVSVYKYFGESISVNGLNTLFMLTPISGVKDDNDMIEGFIAQVMGRVKRDTSTEILKKLIFDFIDPYGYSQGMYKKRRTYFAQKKHKVTVSAVKFSEPDLENTYGRSFQSDE